MEIKRLPAEYKNNDTGQVISYLGCFNCNQGSKWSPLVFYVQSVHLDRHNRHRCNEEHDPEYSSHPVLRGHYSSQAMRGCVVTEVLDERPEFVSWFIIDL